MIHVRKQAVNGNGQDSNKILIAVETIKPGFGS